MLLALPLAGCANVAPDAGYLWQSVRGHLGLMNAAQPVDRWLSDDATPIALKNRLLLAQRIRAFASTELKLPDNASYHRYADLKRAAAVWNVVAAPPYSLTPRDWCFPITGCVGYRGYFDAVQARAFADKIKAEGLDVSVYAVPAYSTLGYMNWAGGDPLLNTFINYPEGELARIIIHELAHQKVYASGDTAFNESFATSVERIGGARWLSEHSSPAARREYAEFDARRNQFRQLVRSVRAELQTAYADESEPKALAAGKAAALADLRARYAALKASWGGNATRYAGYDSWVANANNASFASFAAYDELVPDFEALFARSGQDWQRFYAAVARLAKLPKDERRDALKSFG